MTRQSKAGMPKKLILSKDFEGALKAHHEALESAIDILGPFPWKTPERSLKTLAFAIPTTVNRREAKKLVRDIARSYWRDLEEDGKSPRVKETQKTLQAIVKHCNGLAARLKNLSRAEIQLLAQSIQPGRDVDKWLDMTGRLPSVGFPSAPQLPHGSAVAWLELLSAHTRWVASELENRSDRGGNTNLFRQRLAAPSWRLIGRCWTFFELTPHLEPSGTTDGKLHQFLGAIHELVTGEVTDNKKRRGPNPKLFATSRRRFSDLTSAIDEIAVADPKLDPDLFYAVLFRDRSDLRNQLPPRSLRQAEKLLAEWKALRDVIMHGPATTSSGSWKLG